MLYRIRFSAFLACLLAFGLLACNTTGREIPTRNDPDKVWPGMGRWAGAQLKRMTLEQKVSQLFSCYAYGTFTSADDPAYRRLVALVEDFGIGGIVFFQGDPFSQALLANDLQQRARVPLLVSQDMEWGPGMRIDHTTTLPRTMALGAARETDLAYAAGHLTAEEARAVGTHQILAPVADVNNNPYNPIINVRSFGERPGLVADMVSAFVQGAQDGGVLATVKHFPGHGDTDVDSHSDLPVLSFDRERLDTLELVPFRAAVEHGVMSVMSGHLALPALEPDVRVPASLSPRITRALLRDAYGFEGLIVTDALRMRGVTKHFGVGEAAVRALEAGNDMLLLTDDEVAARRAVLQAVKAGRLTERRIDQSVLRILHAKEWAGLNEERLVDLAAARRHIATQQHEALSATIALRSLTLLRNEGGVLPLLGPPRRLLVVTLSDGDDPDAGRTFARALRPLVAASTVTARLLDRRSDEEDYRAVVAEASEHDVVVVPAYLFVRDGSGRIGLPERHRSFLDALIATDRPVVLVSFGSPYMAAGLAEQPAAYLAAYGASGASQRAAAQALTGRAPISGQLPVTLPGTYPYGTGLRLHQATLRQGFAEEVGLDGHALLRIDSLMRAAIAQRAFPGAAVAIGRAGVLAKSDGYGYFTYDSEQQVTPQSRFDLASLTKVIATTTAAMQLYEAGRLDLDAAVSTYLPAFGQNGKGGITFRQLLSHTSGLPPYIPFHQRGITTRNAVLDAIMSVRLAYPPGTEMRYSDLGFITLALVVESITGEDFATYTHRHIFEPLGMHHTGFLPTGRPDTTIVPTEQDKTFRKRLIQGEVHDETAWILGGTAGHAGLFSTADDLAAFAFMLVNGGRAQGRPFLKEETLRLFTTPVDVKRHSRALGWDTRSLEGYSSAGQYFGPRSFGHTGFTGTSLWIDPDQQLFVILLTNRVYPSRENRGHVAVRPKLADLAYLALRGAPEPLLPKRPK